MDKARMTFTAVLALLAFSVATHAATRSTPVTVVNTDGEPVPVTVVEATSPVNACAVLSPFGGTQTIYSVPADMTLTIEYSTVDPVNAMDEGDVVKATINTTVGGVEGSFFAGMVTGREFTFAADGRVMKAYADPGTDVTVVISIRNYVDDVEICLSGRLSPAD